MKKSKLKEDLIPGGKGDKLSVKNVNSKELQMGIKTELEHTGDSDKAREIALDHLAEDPKYYSKLKGAGLADELEEAVRKEIRSVIKEYYDDEQRKLFIDSVVFLVVTCKNALSKDLEVLAEKYYTKYPRSAREITKQLTSAKNFIDKLTR